MPPIRLALLHRDIKPSNILLDDDDFAYLIDFGIARVIEETRVTKSGDTLGTFQYIAPERLDVQALEDARADIYSLACVLYESLTGHPPFPGQTMAHLVAAHLNTPPPRPSIDRPDVPAQVDEVIATGMAKDPEQRYATTIELANAARDAITTPIAQRPDVSEAPASAPQPADGAIGSSRTDSPVAPTPTGPDRRSDRCPVGRRRRRRLSTATGSIRIPCRDTFGTDRATGTASFQAPGPRDRTGRPATQPEQPRRRAGGGRHERDRDLHRHGHRHHNGPGVRRRRSDGISRGVCGQRAHRRPRTGGCRANRLTSSFSTWCRFARLMMRARSSPPLHSSGQPAPAGRLACRRPASSRK